jgi:hypothetical protein
MAKGRRREPRYARENLAQARELAEAAKIAEDAAALSRAIWNGRLESLCDTWQQKRRGAEQAYWATVDPASRLRRIRPFGPSPEHGITREDVHRLEEVKLATLGYLECTILKPDEDRYHLSVGHLGSVASQGDGERLVAALAVEFAHVPFRITLEEVLLENVLWRSINDVLNDAQPDLSIADLRRQEALRLLSRGAGCGRPVPSTPELEPPGDAG